MTRQKFQHFDTSSVFQMSNLFASAYSKMNRFSSRHSQQHFPPPLETSAYLIISYLITGDFPVMSLIFHT